MKNKTFLIFLLIIIIAVSLVIVRGRFFHLKERLKKFAFFLSLVNSYILLTISYFFAIVPIGIIFRLFNRSVVSVPRSNTYWIERHLDSDSERPF